MATATKKAVPEPKLQELVQLKVSNWYDVGLHLGVNDSDLEALQKSFSDVRDCRREMYKTWLRITPQPTYAKLASAFFLAEEDSIAYHICKKYGLQVPGKHDHETPVSGIETQLLSKSLTQLPTPPTSPSQFHYHFNSPQAAQFMLKSFSGSPISTQPSVPILQLFGNNLRSIYQSHSLFPADAWPPRLSDIYINLALIEHEKLPLAGQQSLSKSEKATLHGTIDDLCFHKYNVSLEHMLKPDTFLLRKEKVLTHQQEQYEKKLVRLLNLQAQSLPASFRKRHGIPDDSGEDLPQEEEVREVLKLPEFLRGPRLRTLLITPTSQSQAEEPPVSPSTVSASVPEVFPPDQKGIKVLIDGAPGVGKTTLTWKASQDWAMEKLFKDYKLVIRTSLRDLPQNLQHIWELLPEASGSKALREAVAKELEDTLGEDIMLILDGWDELSREQRKQDSLVCKLVRGDLLPRCSVLITSRPHTSRWLQLPNMVPRHIEIVGFTQEQIQTCIRHAFINDNAAAEKLIKLLEVRTDIFKLCYIPHNLCIVLYIYKIMGCRIPTTLTHLYQYYTTNAMIRHMQTQEEDTESPLQVEDRSKLPPEVQDLYASLCEVALKGLLQGRMVFSDEELESINPALTRNTLRLMTASKKFAPSGISQSFQFIHATIQEFLAAEALSKQSAERQMQFIVENVSKSQFRMTLIFLAGISNLKSVESLFHVPVSYDGYPNIDRLLLLLRMIYEAQSPELCQILAQRFPGRSLLLSSFTSFKMMTVSEFDLLMIRYLLSHSNFSWKAFEPYEGSLQAFIGAFTDTSSAVSIEELHIHSSASKTPYEELCNSQIPAFRRLRAIKLTIESPISKQASDLLHLSTLTHLHVECASQTDFELAMEATAENRSLQYLSLKTLKRARGIDRNRLSLSPTAKLPLQLTFLLFEDFVMTDAFASKLAEILTSQHLHELRFKRCVITPTQMRALFISLQSNSSLKVLHISQPPFSKFSWEHEECDVLHEMLSTNTTLSSLQLYQCSIDPHVADRIAQALKHNHSLSILDLSHNNNITIRLEGLLHSVAEHPFDNALMPPRQSVGTIQILKLMECGLGDEDAKHIAAFLSNAHSSVKELDLFSNRIQQDGGNSIFSALAGNNTLQVLNLSHNPLWISDGVHIEHMMEHNCSLKKLSLQNAGLHVPAIQGIANGIAKNSTLAVLELGVSLKRTPVEGACVLFAGLKKSTSLKSLALSGYDLQTAGTQALVDAVTGNETLSSLVFLRCRFGDTQQNQAFIDCLYSHKSLTNLSLPSTEDVFQQIFAQYDTINWIRKKNNLPYVQVHESNPIHSNFELHLSADENKVSTLLP